MKKKIIKLHKEDKEVAYNFIDYVRLGRGYGVRVALEIQARYVAEFIGISPDVSNAKLADKFASLFESGKIA